jgi:hypothetical protein
MSIAAKDPVSALRSDIAALRAIVKSLDYLTEDYRKWPPISDNLQSAATLTAYALAALQKRLPEERPAK